MLVLQPMSICHSDITKDTEHRQNNPTISEMAKRLADREGKCWTKTYITLGSMAGFWLRVLCCKWVFCSSKHSQVLVAIGCCVTMLVAIAASMVMNLLVWSLKSFCWVSRWASSSFCVCVCDSSSIFRCGVECGL